MKTLPAATESGRVRRVVKRGRRAGSAFAALVLGVSLIAFGLAGPAWAAAGDLDPTFGTGGKVTTDFAGREKNDAASAVAIQADGKIVAAGLAFTGSKYDFALARYEPDGTLDPTFGTGGKVTTDFAGDYDAARAVAIQEDGKIVAAGSASTGSGDDFALARYQADGSLDPTFGTGGKVTTDFAGDYDAARAVAIQGDGKIVAAGGSGDDFALARYQADGSLDPTFGTGGEVATDFAGSGGVVYAVAIEGDGKIVAAGSAFTGSTDDFALARYQADGSLDPMFGTGGKVITDFAGSGSFAFGLAIQGDGKMVAAGGAITGQGNDFALARYEPDGTLDPTFGMGGEVTTDIAGSGSVAYAVAIQGDGRIVAAGDAVTSQANDFALARYEPGGNLDPTFGTGGKVTTDYAGTFDFASAVAIQGDGKIVAAGYAGTATYDFALARYQGEVAPLTLPTITSVKPGAVGQGGTRALTINGSDFQPGAAVSVSGTGVTVLSTTFSVTKLGVTIKVATNAKVGARDITVTNPDGGTGTCVRCLTIDPAPNPTSASPSSGAPGTTMDVDILGSDFQAGAKARFGSGITVNSTTFVSSSHLTANIAISSGATRGRRTVDVVNPDLGQGSCASCFRVT